MKDKLVPYFPLVLAVFHIVGFYLFLRDPGDMQLTSLNLLLCGFLVYLSEPKKITAIAYLVIFLLGFVIELIGVRTGWLFGSYQYTDVLGEKVFGVPVTIGINWFVIVVSSSALFIKLKRSVIIKAILAGLAATAMDVLLEPVAVKYHFWIWENDVIPFYNYICWFIFSTLFAYLYMRLTDKQNRTGFFLYFIWIVFFVALNLS